MSSRNFEKILFGRPFWQAPIITSRICRDHSISHNLASSIATEMACGINVSGQTNQLRELLLSAEIIRNHSKNIFFHHLPEYIDLKHPDNHHLVRDLETMDKFSTAIIAVISGRGSHPISSTTGGFKKIPERDDFKLIISSNPEAQVTSDRILRLIESVSAPDQTEEKIFCSLHSSDRYPTILGDIWSTSGAHFSAKNYQDYFFEEKIAGSSTVTITGNEFIVGPEARYKQNKKHISSPAENSSKTLDLPGLAVATAIELQHFTAAALHACLDFSKTLKQEHVLLPSRYSNGTAAIESPRGLMIHQYELDSEGKITKYDIVTPSEINRKDSSLCRYCLGH